MQLSAVSVGVRNRRRETAVLEECSGRCPLLLRGRRTGGGGGVPRLKGTQSKAFRKKPRGRQTTRTPRVGGPPREDPGESFAPSRATGRGARGLSPGRPRPRVPTAAADGEEGRQREHSYSGTKMLSAGTTGAGCGTRLPRRHVGRGQLPAGPAPACEGGGPGGVGAGHVGQKAGTSWVCPLARPEVVG